MNKNKIIYFGLPPNSGQASGYSKWFFPVFNSLQAQGDFDVSLLNYNDKLLNEHSGKFAKLALPYLTFKLNKELGRNKNVVHVLRQNSWFSDLFMSCNLLSKHDIMKVVTIHDILKEDGSVDHRVGAVIKGVDAIFCPSHYTKNSIVDNFKIDTPIFVTYNPLDNRYSFNGSNNERDRLKKEYSKKGIANLDGKRVVMNVSSEIGRKNIETMLHIISELNKNQETYLLKIGRPTRNRPKYLELAQSLNIIDKVIWVDWVGENELVQLYQLSDLFLTLSEGEGFCMPLIEAMSCGLPIIAVNRTAIPEILGGVGLLVEPNDISDIVEKCDKVLSDQSLRENMRAQGEIRSQSFRTDIVTKRYLDAYDEILI